MRFRIASLEAAAAERAAADERAEAERVAATRAATKAAQLQARVEEHLQTMVCECVDDAAKYNGSHTVPTPLVAAAVDAEGVGRVGRRVHARRPDPPQERTGRREGRRVEGRDLLAAAFAAEARGPRRERARPQTSSRQEAAHAGAVGIVLRVRRALGRRRRRLRVTRRRGQVAAREARARRGEARVGEGRRRRRIPGAQIPEREKEKVTRRAKVAPHRR